MEVEKKYFGGWWIYLLCVLVVTVVVLAGLNYAGVIGQTIVERKVFENSYQKHEADKTAVTVYAAQLAQLRAKFNNPSLTESARVEILAQIDAIMILKTTKAD